MVDNLPLTVTTFVGRRTEVADVKRLLGSARLVTLTGMGGVGKTRLALDVARNVRRAYADGVWFVGLADLAEPDLVPVAVMESIGAQVLRDDSRKMLVEYLRKRQALLILDNCEHLVDACATLTDAILTSCPMVHVLATTREPLRIGGERLYPVPPLDFPTSDETIDHGVSQFGSVALFVERASAVCPDFAVTTANQQAVATLCRNLDGLPLAIELAAARMPVLSVDELLARQHDRFGLLARGSRASSPRQQTLRASIGWSFDLCSRREQLLWERLSVFSGTFDLAAAEFVCSGAGLERAEVFEAITGLVEKSVVVCDSRTRRARYRLLDAIREYGGGRMRDRGEERQLRERHRDYYLALAEHVDREWFGPGQVDLFEQVRAEQGNIRAALDFCLDARSDNHLGLRLAGRLFAYWFATGSQREGRHWLRRLLARDREDPSSPRDRLAALWAFGHLGILIGELGSAEETFAECGELAAALGDRRMLAHVAYGSGLVTLSKPDPAPGRAQAESALELERRIEPLSPMLPLAMIDSGYALCVAGDAAGAEAILHECREICEEHGDRWVRSWSLAILGLASWTRGDWRRATELLRTALRDKRLFNDLLGMGLSMEFLAWIAVEESQVERAARLFGACEKLWESLGTYLVGFDFYLGQHDQYVKQVRSRLGAPEFDRLLSAGLGLSRPEALSYALGEGHPGLQNGSTSRRSRPDGLTRREREIAELVARGMSNREIADELVISVRTVEAHVDHVLRKLGFTSRTQVAAWVTELRQTDQASRD